MRVSAFRFAFSFVLLTFFFGGTSSGFAQPLASIENAILFHPSKKLEGTPGKIHLKYEEASLHTADNVKLHAWWTPCGNARATMIFSHGNAGNISHRLEKLKIFHDLGLNVFIYDYRGYGRSTGLPSEKGLYADAQAAYEYVVNVRKIPADEIIAYGESLGGPVTAHLAAHNAVKAMILDSTFTSLKDMAHARMPLLAGLAGSHYDTLADIAKIKSPTLVLHSPNDDVIPYEQGRKLFAASTAHKQFVVLSGGHNDGFLRSKKKYVAELNDFISEYVADKNLR